MKLQKTMEQLVVKASFSLRDDVRLLLRRAYKKEKNKKAKRALSWILENAHIAETQKLAICQDTGLPIVFIEAGSGIKIDSSFVQEVKKGVEQAYKKHYLRASIVDPLLRGKSSYRGIICHLNFSSKRNDLLITVFPKGFGSENKSKLEMFNPTANIEDIEAFIVDSIKEAGPESCPPFVVGVGIGATSDGALLLAKEAMLERINKPNPDAFLNRLERNWLKKINSLGIGPMGLGGNCTALAVKVKTASTHIAGLPVGINISCWALRSASTTIRI